MKKQNSHFDSLHFRYHGLIALTIVVTLAIIFTDSSNQMLVQASQLMQ